MRGLAIIAVVFLAYGGGMRGAHAATLCERVDWSGPHEGLGPNVERYGRIQRSYQRSDGLALIKAHLPQVYENLESTDPVVRRDACTQLRTMREWFQWREKELDSEAVLRIEQLLDRETNVQVVDEAVRALGTPKAFSKKVVPYIVEILRCPDAGASKQEALQVARYGLDPALVDPLLELWKSGASVPNRDLVLMTLAELKDPRAASVAIAAMAEGLANGPVLFRALGSRESLPAAIDIYRKAKGSIYFRWSFLGTAAEIGGPDAVALLKEELEGAAESEKGDLADKVLQAQLEPGKPTYTEEDRRNCRPADDVQARRVPLLRKEVERLLDEGNRPFFEANRWRNSVVLGDLLEWAHMLEPGARVAHLRRVLDLVGEGPSGAAARTSCQRDLLLALASRASARTTSDPAGALRDVEEAERLLPSARGSNLETPLRALRARIDRLTSAREQEPASEAGDVVGTYKRGGGFEAHTLTLKPDGTFDFVGTSDAIDMCRPNGFSSTGRYSLERGYVIFTPGPGIKRFGIDGSDALLPVPWGARMYLLSDDEVPALCKAVNEGSVAAPSRLVMSYHYVRAASDEPPTGQPRIPERWRGWLLAEPVLGTITRLATDSSVEVDVGEEEGLKVGMNLFAVDDSARRWWRIVEVGAKTVLAKPYSADQPLPPMGLRVSTRANPIPATMGARPVPVMVAARVRRTADPVTPATAAGVSGTVVVSVMVDEKGHVVDVTGYKRQMGRGMDEAASEAAKRYEFEPATQDGRPIPSIVNIPVNFVSKP